MPHETFHYKSWADIEHTAASLGISLPRSENLDVLKAPLDVGGHTAHNRIALQPMEGTDGTGSGSPGELTVRRYLRFAEGGAGLSWTTLNGWSSRSKRPGSKRTDTPP